MTGLNDKQLIALGRLVAQAMDDVRTAPDMGEFVAGAEYSITIETKDDGDWTIKVARPDFYDEDDA